MLALVMLYKDSIGPSPLAPSRGWGSYEGPSSEPGPVRGFLLLKGRFSPAVASNCNSCCTNKVELNPMLSFLLRQLIESRREERREVFQGTVPLMWAIHKANYTNRIITMETSVFTLPVFTPQTSPWAIRGQAHSHVNTHTRTRWFLCVVVREQLG